MYKRISLLLVVVFVFVLTKAQSDGCISPPGVVINHISKSTGKYIGSPSICILPNGDYVASHDEFGPKSSEYRSAITHIFTSNDKGETWKKISSIDGQFWSNLFYHNDALYIMGTNKHHGNLIIRKSTDGGNSWSIPYDSKNGLILEGEYHTAPVPMLIHKGRIYRAVEYATGKTTRWGERYSAMVVSAPVKSDLLNAKNWTRSNHLSFNKEYLNGEFKAWLEGNVVVTKDGKLIDILRVHAPGLPNELSAFVDVNKKGKKASFNPDNFFKMPGSSKKFTIRYDEKTGKYWSIVNYVLEEFKQIQSDKVRNTLALISSPDLKEWKVEKIVLQHPDVYKHGFQYVDWLLEDNDVIFVSRTAFGDEKGGADRAHDANFMTFHRIKSYNETINNIVPRPLSVINHDGNFILNENTVIKYSSPDLLSEANYLAKKILVPTGYKLKVVTGDVVADNEIFLYKHTNRDFGIESYSMDVTPKSVIIKGSDAQGIFYGIQTLFQLLPPEIESLKKKKGIQWNVPAVSINDSPRFQWRGLMMDIGRQFMPAEFIKKQIDVLAMYKINTLHLHLTDDMGWRIEVKGYPKLQEIGSKRTEFDGRVHSGLLSQKEVIEIVEYAKKRHITIVPELELPGHAMAALASYPELACNESKFEVRNIHGIERNVFCAGKEETFIFWEDVLAEIIPLFPGEFIHIGGDECPKDRWLECPHCTKRIKDEKLQDVHELQSYFIKRIEKIVNSYGKKIVGWDEILEEGINPSATVMSWRGEKGGIKAANAGHNVVMTPNNYLYIDYEQADYKVEPPSIGRFNTLKRVYGYNPIPESLSEDKHQHILGAQVNVWGEYTYTPELFEYRAYPRTLALAEASWTTVKNKDYDSFEKRLYNQLVRLDYHDINYHIPQPEQPGGSCNTVSFVDSVELTFKTVRPEKMVYTLNGKEPNINSLEYMGPLKIKESATLKIRTILPSGKMSPVRIITVQKQTFSPVVEKDNVRQGLSGKQVKGRFVTVNDLDSVVNWDTIHIKSLKDIYKVQVNKPFGEEAFFAMVLTGYIDIPEDAVYYFSTITDQFWIDGKLLINNENEVKRYARTDSSVALGKGLHPIKIVYLSNVTGGWPNVWSGLDIEYRNANTSKFTPIKDSMLFY